MLGNKNEFSSSHLNCKQLLIIVFVVGMGAIATGCEGFLRVGNDFLKKPPSEGVTIDTVFSSPVYAKQFLWGAYTTLTSGAAGGGPYDTDRLGDHVPLAAITDINQGYNNNNGGGQTVYYPGNYSAATENPSTSDRTKYNFYFSGAWEGIRKAHIFLENIGRVPNMDTQTKQRLKAEARMIIAFHYIELFRNYGGMIWVDHAYKPNEDFQLPRLTAKATLDSIVAVIDRAVPHLPFALKKPNVNGGRFTQAAAMGLKCRLLLFAASPLFNDDEPYMSGEASREKLVWFGGYNPDLWQRAANVCGTLIDKVEQTGAYHLVNTGNPRMDFRRGYLNRNSPEILLSIRKMYMPQGGGNGRPRSLIAEGVGATTDNYVKMFPMEDGTPIHAPGSGYDPAHPYKNRDPRLYETVLVNGVSYRGRTAELYIGGREHPTKNHRITRTGYRTFKFVIDIISVENKPVQYPYIRLSEIYLSYAEALNEVNGGPTPEAYKYVNKVRNRVGLNDLPTGLSQVEFRHRVLRERVLELGYENIRWFDMIRWKRKDLFTKTLYGMYICKKGVSPEGACQDLGYGRHESANYIYTRFKLEERYWSNHFSPKWYLSAFPRKEMLKDYGLIQNPGW